MTVRRFLCVAAVALLAKGTRPDPDSGMLTRFPFGAWNDLKRDRNAIRRVRLRTASTAAIVPL